MWGSSHIALGLWSVLGSDAVLLGAPTEKQEFDRSTSRPLDADPSGFAGLVHLGFRV